MNQGTSTCKDDLCHRVTVRVFEAQHKTLPTILLQISRTAERLLKLTLGLALQPATDKRHPEAHFKKIAIGSQLSLPAEERNSL